MKLILNGYKPQRGINRAEKLHNAPKSGLKLRVLQENTFEYLCESYVKDTAEYLRGNYGKTCVFLSHKSCDKPYAKIIGDRLNDEGLDVYLDMYDDGLQGATERRDDKAIVQHIQLAIACSTHILVLLSENTHKSWWVPYEVGYAQKSKCEIASLKLGDSFIPEYLKIKDVIEVEPQHIIENLKDRYEISDPYDELGKYVNSLSSHQIAINESKS